ncbi:hypothetical protein KR093_005104 [Drosophila rubida]|uniref:Uncharacterized protein n=1 Tax=Drosophila rubida TaxID=30044 RepID=A0AAD4PTF7_9MUSC|nr:hypothetical protein KR093_005104 [Drosophila rubida]
MSAKDMNRRKSSRKSSIRKSRKSSRKVVLEPSLVINCKFVLDIIVTNLDTPQVKTDDKKKLNISVHFNGQLIEITENCINVDDFVEGTGTTFTANPFTLRQTVEGCGMPVSVKYDGELIGSGLMLFPESFTENIAEDMSDAFHLGTCQLKNNEQIVGTIEFQMRLLINCTIEQKGPSECRQLMGCCIKPHDILFLVTDTQNPCESCIEEETGEGRLNFDLLSYQTPKHIPTAAETMLYNPGLDNIKSELKQMTAECLKTLDSVLRGTNLSQPPPDEPEQQTADPAASYSIVPQMKAAVGNANQEDSKPRRTCHGCLANMSWLPAFAACPLCGLKPSPVSEDTRMADQIVVEFLGRPDLTVEDICSIPVVMKRKKPEHVCRCTCKYGKVCAHCRVRKKCAEFMDIEQINELEKPPESPKIEEESEEDILDLIDNMKLEEKSSRPFLARVFSEMRDLHEIKDTVRLEDLEIEEQTKKKTRKRRFPRNQRKSNRKSAGK